MTGYEPDNYVGVITTLGYFLCRECSDKAQEIDRRGSVLGKVYATPHAWSKERCDACRCEVRH